MKNSDLKNFEELSNILTGMELSIHCPDRNLLCRYYKNAHASDPQAFDEMLSLYASNKDASHEFILQLILKEKHSDVRLMGQAVMLQWYLGYWYDPSDLKSFVKNENGIQAKVISENSYLKGLVWKVMKTQPMGYSDKKYGYWSQLPDSEE